ncbi:MAG TPA: glycosyltransferase, partial [Pyrinomonadaceae bacterium]|nr:glycosyltransferase [Pyrinomonadaceae bacterium]
MRVLHVIPSVSERSGGPATAIIPMCRALMREGIEVLLVTTDAGLPGTNGDVVEYKGVPARFFHSQWGESFKYSRPMASWLATNIRNFDLAHIHAVFNHSSVAAARACRETGVPYVIRPLGTLDPWSMTQKSLRKRLFWHVSGKALLQRAATVHYTSEAEKLSTERRMALNHGKVIALGIETSTTSEGVADHFPELARDPYVLVLSRLHPKKGLDVLIEAFQSLGEEFSRWRLVLAGDGPSNYVSRLKSKAQGDRILFTGWLEGERKEAVLGGASLLVLPSHQENFGLCVMEALAHSVPVLVSPNVNLAPEIAANNAGWIAAIDKDALAGKLAEALRDKEELARRGRAGRQLSQKYSWENAARGLTRLYQEILDAMTGGHGVPPLQRSK